MPIMRAARPQSNFTTLGNTLLRDHTLSFRARGLLAYVLSMPDHWTTSSVRLARAGAEGRDAIRAAMRELEDAGYLTRQRQQSPKGQWITVTIIHDEPVTKPVDKGGELSTTEDGFPGVGFPGAISKDYKAMTNSSSNTTTLSIREHEICGICRGSNIIMNGLTSVQCPGIEGYPHA